MTLVAHPVALAATGLYGRSLSPLRRGCLQAARIRITPEGASAMLLLVPVAGLEPARLAAGAFETPMSTIPTHWHLFIKWCDRLDLNQGLPACRAGTLLRRPHGRRVLNFILSPGENDRSATAQNPLSYEPMNLVRLPGLEPGASCVSGRRSTAEL